MFKLLLLFAGVITIGVVECIPTNDRALDEGRAGLFGMGGLFGNFLNRRPNRRPNRRSSDISTGGSLEDSDSEEASVSVDDLQDNLLSVATTCQEKTKNLNLVRLANNKVYWLANQWQTTWAGASEECRSRGMHLASINSIFENTVIKDYIEREQGTTLTADVWFALNTLSGGTIPLDEYTNLPPIFSDWNGDGPMAASLCGVLSIPPDLLPGEIFWAGVDCAGPLSFICEMDSICEKFVKPTYYPLYTH